jgi:hypothetical protein
VNEWHVMALYESMRVMACVQSWFVPESVCVSEQQSVSARCDGEVSLQQYCLSLR